MRFLIYACLFIFFADDSWAGDGKYSITDIPLPLLKGANAVKRIEESHFEIVSMRETLYRWKYAITILNEKGAEHAGLEVGYDKLRKIIELEGNLYDAFGKQIRRVKNKDVQDLSAIDDISLFDDNRVKVHNFNYRDYPYTVEYEVEMRYNNSYFMPRWMPQDGSLMAVQESVFSFTAPKDYDVRYKAFNYQGDPVKSESKNEKTLTWAVKNLPGISRSYASPKWIELTTTVLFAPSSFEFEGYKGSANTWEDLGRFQIALNEGRDELPAEVLEKVRSLTTSISDDREKVKALYSYLQKNTRYISIQLGIGGLQPFEASFVAKKGYGDCKALSNYMYSLLKAAGIASHYAWVNGGSSLDYQYVIEDFPSDQFNHIILCVPLKQDTMWLECTSQDVAAGYMGDFTGNRKALLITPQGGKLVSTPRYNVRDNVMQRQLKGSLSDKGNLDFTCFTKYAGTQQDDLSGLVSRYSKEKVQEVLQQKFDLATYHVNSFKYDEVKGALPELDEQLDVSVSGYGSVTGRRIFLQPNVLNRSGRRLMYDSTRNVDYVFGNGYRDEDSYELAIPPGYKPEQMPQDVNVKTKFGSYTSTLKLENNMLIYSRVIEQYSGRFPASDQKELINFFNEIYKADRARIVLVKEG